MNMTLSTLAILFLSTFAIARPQHMTGSWFQSGQIEILSIKDHRITSSKEETQELKSKGYICRQEINRTRCEKFLPVPNQLPQNILSALRNLAPKNVQLHPTQEPFHSVHESMSYNEWGKRQPSLVDGLVFTRLHWREVSGSPARIILSREQDSERIEFLVSENKQLQKFVSANLGHALNWQKFTVLIKYQSLR
jgi:hypothetical protein